MRTQQRRLSLARSFFFHRAAGVFTRRTRHGTSRATIDREPARRHACAWCRVALSFADGNTAIGGRAEVATVKSGTALVFTRSNGVWTHRATAWSAPVHRAILAKVPLSGPFRPTATPPSWRVGEQLRFRRAWVFTQQRGCGPAWRQAGRHMCRWGRPPKVPRSPFGADGKTANLSAGHATTELSRGVGLHADATGCGPSRGRKLVGSDAVGNAQQAGPSPFPFRRRQPSDHRRSRDASSVGRTCVYTSVSGGMDRRYGCSVQN